MTAPPACLNPEILPAAAAKASIWDRGFVFGASMYAVLRLYSGRMWLKEAHFDRLRRSLGEMQFPPVDHDLLLDRVSRLIATSGIGDGTLYIQITRGVAPRL